MIILNATASRNSAIRNTQTGLSDFIDELCKQLEKRRKFTIYQGKWNLDKYLQVFFLRYRSFKSRIWLIFHFLKVMIEVTNLLAMKQYIVRRGDETHNVQIVPQFASTLRKQLTFWDNYEGFHQPKLESQSLW